MTQKLGASGGLIVRGEDQLYSFKEPVAEFRSVTIKHHLEDHTRLYSGCNQRRNGGAV